MPTPTKLLALLATVLVLFVAVASAQNDTSTTGTNVTTTVTQPPEQCPAGHKFCNSFMPPGGNAKSPCCCATSTTCGVADTFCYCIPEPTTRPVNNKTKMTSSSWVFFGISAALLVLIAGFAVYYKVQKRRARSQY